MFGLKNLSSNVNYQQERGERKMIKNYSYGLNDKIGKGYSSIVYKGRNENTGEVVAIKVIDLKTVKDDIGKEMLQSEIEAIQNIKHQNVLSCYNVHTTANNCYIITELCNEGDMANLLAKNKKFNQKDATVFIKDICQGFFEIARNNYIHRDLKLANIFLKNGVAKIADFGFAKKNTNPGQRQKYNVGSPLYMPIQSLKNNIYSIKSDIWSIGIIIYELLHGQTPWQCKTQKQLMSKMVKVPITFKSSLSSDLKDFIKKCLQIDECKRFSIDQMRNHAFIKRICSQNINNFRQLQQNKAMIVENQDDKQNSPIINKAIFDGNNHKILQYINTFRLLFKIVCDIKKWYPSERILIQSISSLILNRINKLQALSRDPCQSIEKSVGIDLKQVEKYFNPIFNPSIKKYIQVIDQYSQRYNSDLVLTGQSQGDIYSLLRQFLKTHSVTEQGTILFFWISEFLTLPNGRIRREVLQDIVDPKHKPLVCYVQQKIHTIIY